MEYFSRKKRSTSAGKNGVPSHTLRHSNGTKAARLSDGDVTERSLRGVSTEYPHGMSLRGMSTEYLAAGDGILKHELRDLSSLATSSLTTYDGDAVATDGVDDLEK